MPTTKSKPSRNGKAKMILKPIAAMPSQPIAAPAVHVPDGTQSGSDRRAAILSLRNLQAQRSNAIRVLTANTNNARAYVRRVLGFDTTMAEADRKAIVAAADRVYAAILAGTPLADPVENRAAEAAAPFVMATKAAAGPVEALRASTEKDMATIAATLPGAKFAERVRGFSVMRLAVILGEAGDLADYATPSKLWKRMGLAPDDEYRMTTKDGNEAICKPRRRRSEMFVIGDCLIKGNADGPYRTLYLERKEYETPRVKTKMHAHRRAQRVMEKRLLLDLWVAYREEM